MAIHILPPELVAKIAAGEVVERPASVVKELLENALDAGARSVRIEVRGGGRDLIRVADDGVGMTPEDVRLAVEPHATSKVTALADLIQITTLGFRGEALSSIAAVSRFSMLSRPLGSDSAFELTLDGGRLVTERAKGGPQGTAVTVRDLFQHVPARLKFLRSVQTETAFITRVVQAYALGRPDVRFELTVDGRSSLRTAGDGDLRAAAGQVFGHTVAAAMLPLPEDDTTDEMPVRASGFVSHPAHDRGDRNAIMFFVNGRWVQHRGASFALEEAYHSLLMVGRHPSAVIHFAVPASLVDVNVHPTKQEVRFVHEREVTRAVGAGARAAVLGTTHTTAVPLVNLPTSFATTNTSPSMHAHGWAAPTDMLPAPRGSVTTATGVSPSPWRRIESSPDTPASLPDSPKQTVALPVADSLRVIGQVAHTYIVAENASGMYLIDQHAAHERVMLERMRVKLARGEHESQFLLVPLPFSPPATVQETLETYADDLTALGFGIEPFGAGSWLLRAVPAPLMGPHRRDPVTVLEETLAELGAGGTGGDGRERVAALLACHNAIRAGQTLSDVEMHALIRELEAVDTPGHCAHGRPTMLHISQHDLEREFSRR